MTYIELEKLFEKDFAAAGIETPQVDAARLVADITGASTLEMFLHPDREVPREQEELLRELALRRCRREPLQYLTGKAWFRELELEVSPAVLIPRPETELLVDFLLENAFPGARVLDLGTGSGAIALSCAFERPDLAVTAADISSEALETARKNARRCGAEVRFVQSDLFSALEGEVFDLIGANLPYVTDEEYETLSPEVRDHEPRLALTAPEEGLALIFKTAEALDTHLVSGGKAAFELSPFQAPRLKDLLEKLGYNARIARDLTGRDRFVFAEKK